MKILFVSSGNTKYGKIPFVLSQEASLKRENIRVEHFFIKGRGYYGYLKNVFLLRNSIKLNRFNLIHAHYSKAGYVCSLASIGLSVPIIVSLMGSDVHSNPLIRCLLRILSFFTWKAVIVKSKQMKRLLGIKKVIVIPNGVDLSTFKDLKKEIARKRVNFDRSKKYIIWVSDPKRFEKNYELASKSVQLLYNDKIELFVVNNISHSKIPIYISAADVLLLTSRWEGSPNVIKEAMACNCPIVSTRVGDVEWLLGNTEGHYLVSQNPNDVSKKLNDALEFQHRTNGRKRIIELGLDTKSIARKLINIYETII